MSIGTFGAFTQARLGIYASQKGLNVTGNNISNINTQGYTRQALDQVSLRNKGADRYQSKYEARIGHGTLIRGISQLRDPYLDIRYRTEMSSVGYTEKKLEGLDNIASVINEVGKGTGDHEGDGLLYASFSDFYSSLQQLNADAAAESNDTLARASADAITGLFNTYAHELEEIQQNAVARFKQDIAGVNGVLASIRELNTAIRKSEIHGDNALEMRDERNNLIDKLSEYMKIDVVYTMEDVGAGQQVEKLTIKLGNANPDPTVDTDSTVLVDGIYARQLKLSEPEEENVNFDLTVGKLLDEKGREWSNIVESTVHKLSNAEAIAMGAPTKARYAFTVGGNLDWSPEGTDTLTIDGVEYTIGGSGENNISLRTASDPARLARFIAGKISENEKYADYDITTDGADIIFTAKQTGVVGQLKDDEGNPLVDDEGFPVMGSGPAAKPTLGLSNGGERLTLTESEENTDGSELDPERFPPPMFKVNEDGTRTITSYAMRGTRWYETKITSEYSKEFQLDSNDLYGSLQAMRETLTGAGEFATRDTIDSVDENAAIKRGIPYYQKSLDLLAKKFADEFNKANTGYAVDQDGNYLDSSGNVLKQGGQPVKNALSGQALDNFLKANGVPMGGNLFSTRGDLDDGEGINASNITVSRGWANGDVHIVTTFTKLFGGEVTNTTQGDNVAHMISLMGKSLVYDPTEVVDGADSAHLFEGSFQDMLIKINSVLGNDYRDTNTMLNTYSGAAVELDTSRDSVSAVDLNDEAMNLMQYSKSLNAAYRLMTTLDEALDRLINNTGIVGR